MTLIRREGLVVYNRMTQEIHVGGVRVLASDMIQCFNKQMHKTIVFLFVWVSAVSDNKTSTEQHQKAKMAITVVMDMGSTFNLTPTMIRVLTKISSLSFFFFNDEKGSRGNQQQYTPAGRYHAGITSSLQNVPRAITDTGSGLRSVHQCGHRNTSVRQAFRGETLLYCTTRVHDN